MNEDRNYYRNDYNYGNKKSRRENKNNGRAKNGRKGRRNDSKRDENGNWRGRRATQNFTKFKDPTYRQQQQQEYQNNTWCRDTFPNVNSNLNNQQYIEPPIPEQIPPLMRNDQGNSMAVSLTPLMNTNIAAPAPAPSENPPSSNISNIEIPPLKHNIKKEKVETEKKPIITPLSAKSSSSSSSEEEDKMPSLKDKDQSTTSATKSKSKDDRKNINAIAEKPSKKTPEPGTSSSSGSESSSESAEPAWKQFAHNIFHNLDAKSTASTASKESKASKKMKHTEEDVICLGNLKRSFFIEDEDEVNSNQSKADTAKGKDQCILCDKKGHSSFHCQMICKNCSEPYHNLKTCPKPANMSTVMSQFMEFCIQQLNNYNPEKTFSQLHKSNAQAKVHTKVPGKDKTKRKAKKRSRKDSDSDNEEDDDGKQQEDDEESSSDSSASDTSKDESSDAAVTTKKRKRKHSRGTSKGKTAKVSPFAHMNDFASLPSLHSPQTATLATYPMLLNHMLQHGGFPPLGFKK